MYIKDIFAKPIDRNLNGVIKVGQDDENVKQELEEYVVTREVQNHFADFFSSYKKGILGTTDAMGVWISGFFGSGKSHFLKILSYLLENRVVDGKTALNYFVDDNKIKDEIVLADMKLAAGVPSDVILFNIDSKGGMGDRQNNSEAILSVFLKAFNQHLGFCGANPFLADLERQLAEEGRYEDFQEAFKEIYGEDWLYSRQKFMFIQDDVCKALFQIDYMSMEAARNWCEASTGTYNIDVATFADMVKAYIDKKGNNHHVIFLVDEMGQYIGDDSKLMLNLQTVTEDLGSACKGKAWVVVTSQQDIDSTTKIRGNDFSKIQGRFDTRLSMSSANVDEVIKKRILEKTEEGRQTLNLLYDEKDTIIKNLIIFNDGVEKKLYSDRDNFSAVYPFVPYQFNLLASVLTSIKIHGASGKHLAEGERSMLALFKESAMNVMESCEGTIVSFNLFYDSIEQFLDYSHKGVIIRAWYNQYLNPDKSKDCFNVNVLKTLSMIKYVDKIIAANLENITSLMVSDINEDRIKLKDRVEKSLKCLEQQALIQKTGSVYTFLTDEEQEINREIENQNVGTAEIAGRISEMIFDGAYSEKKYRYPVFNGRYNFGFNQILDDRPYRGNQNYDISLKIITPNHDSSSDEIIFRMMSGQTKSVIVVLPEDKVFVDEIRSCLKIEKYLKLNSFDITAKHERIKEAKRIEMQERNSNARVFLEQSLRDADIYANGDKIKSTSKDIAVRINDALGRLVHTVYHKLSYIDTAMGEIHIREALNANSDQAYLSSSVQTPNGLALKDVLDFISMNTQRCVKTSMKAIMDRFTKPPYGFVEDDVEWLIARLFKDGDIALFLNDEVINLLNESEDEVYCYLSRREYFEKLLAEQREKANDRQKNAVRGAMKELFNVVPSGEGEDAILKSFRKYAAKLKADLEKLKVNYKNEPSYPGQNVVKSGETMLTYLLSIKYSLQFFRTVDEKYTEILDFAEDYEPVKAFFNGEQVEIWDRSLKLMKIYDDSKIFIVNEEIESTVAEIKEIMKKSSPYGEIRKLPLLLELYTSMYNKMLNEAEKPVIAAINEAYSRVLKELEGRELDMLSKKAFEDFAKIKEKAESCDNVATLQNIKVEADALKVRLINEINALFTANPRIKAQKTMSIKLINPEITWRIETEADIDRYVDNLKEKLKENIKKDTILNIEF